MQKDSPLVLDLDALDAAAVMLRPLGMLEGRAAAVAIAAGWALPLAGGSLAFTGVEVLARRQNGEVIAALAPLQHLRDWALRSQREALIAEQLARLGAARAPWAGLALDRPLVMGVINITPDSFSDGGSFDEAAAAIEHGRKLLSGGADILDIGGESTRPGAVPVPPDQEWQRVEPVIRALAADGAILSIDTRHTAVMAAALDCGARIVNDVSALAGDPDSLALVARRQAPAVLMHMQGEPQTMQRDPRYTLASLDVAEALAGRVAACAAAGIPRERLVVDPGIGFGKAPRHNLEILARLSLLHGLGCALLLGVSRKSLIGSVSAAPVAERLPGSLAGALHALSQGTQILRVHDVAETRQAIALWRAMADGA